MQSNVFNLHSIFIIVKKGYLASHTKNLKTESATHKSSFLKKFLEVNWGQLKIVERKLH